MIIKIITKIFLIILCLNISSCGGFTKVAGLKFKKEVDAKTQGGNPGFLADTVKLNSATIISFPRPIGDCGGGVTFFGILLPIIPVWFTLNKCEESFIINVSGSEVSNVKLKYNEIIHDPIYTKKKIDAMHSEVLYGLLTEFRFKIDNFWKFRMADDKEIIVIGKTKDGHEFVQELPVKWGVMTYNNWVVP